MKYFVPCHAPVIHPSFIPIQSEILHHLSHTKKKKNERIHRSVHYSKNILFLDAIGQSSRSLFLWNSPNKIENHRKNRPFRKDFVVFDQFEVLTDFRVGKIWIKERKLLRKLVKLNNVGLWDHLNEKSMCLLWNFNVKHLLN